MKITGKRVLGVALYYLHLRWSHGCAVHRVERDRSQSGVGVPVHGCRDWIRRGASVHGAHMEQGHRQRRHRRCRHWADLRRDRVDCECCFGIWYMSLGSSTTPSVFCAELYASCSRPWLSVENMSRAVPMYCLLYVTHAGVLSLLFFLVGCALRMPPSHQLWRVHPNVLPLYIVAVEYVRHFLALVYSFLVFSILSSIFLVCPLLSVNQVAALELEGEVTIDTLGMNYPMLTGNLVAICLSGIVCIVVSMKNPDNYDWESTKQIKMVEADDNAWFNDVDYEEESLTKAKSWIMKVGLAFTVVIVIIWPVLSLPAGVFSEAYFDFWVRAFVPPRADLRLFIYSQYPLVVVFTS